MDATPSEMLAFVEEQWSKTTNPPHMSKESAALLGRHAAAIPEGMAYMEIGVFMGGSLAFIARCTRGRRATVLGLDPMPIQHFDNEEKRFKLPEHPLRILFRNLNSLEPEDAGRVRLIPARSHHALTHSSLYDEWRGRVGMLFIDGEHTFDGVARDAEFIHLVPRGGIVAFHDYDHEHYPGVAGVIDELIGAGALAIVEKVGSLVVTRKLVERHESVLRRNVSYLRLSLSAIADEKPASVFLYGAGKHTARLAAFDVFRRLRAKGVIDDNAKPGASVAGVPVVTPADAEAQGVKTIVISTDAYEPVLLPRLRAEWEPKGVRVLGLYDDEAKVRLGRWLEKNSPDRPGR